MKHLTEKEREVLEIYTALEKDPAQLKQFVAYDLLATIDSLRAENEKLKFDFDCTEKVYRMNREAIEDLKVQRDLLLKEVEALREAAHKVKNALAVGTWNVNPERQAFAVECSRLIQQTFDEADAPAKQRGEG